MARHLKKRLIALLMAAVLLASAAVGVLAEDKYLTLTDYGFGTCISSNTTGGYILKSPTYVSDATKNFTLSRTSGTLFVYWAFPIKQDYTYTCTFSFTLTSSSRFSLSKLGSPLYSNVLAGYNDTVSVSSDNVLYSLTVDTANATSVIGSVSVSFNPTLSGIGLNDIYLYAMLKMSNSNDTGVTCSMPSFGVSCKYDPGGSEFSDYLKDIRDQLHAGDDYTPPTSAATDLNNSLTSLDSAEASLSSKAEELRTAGSATMSSAISAAQDLPNKIGASTTFLATTFTRFWEAVPEEVTAVLLVCAAILFAGWLIGRIQ